MGREAKLGAIPDTILQEIAQKLSGVSIQISVNRRLNNTERLGQLETKKTYLEGAFAHRQKVVALLKSFVGEYVFFTNDADDCIALRDLYGAYAIFLEDKDAMTFAAFCKTLPVICEPCFMLNKRIGGQEERVLVGCVRRRFNPRPQFGAAKEMYDLNSRKER